MDRLNRLGAVSGRGLRPGLLGLIVMFPHGVRLLILRVRVRLDKI